MSNRTYQAGEILAAIQAVEGGIAVIVAAKRIGCSIATITRWRSMYRDFSIAEIERALQIKVEVERLRRDAVRYNAERIAWKRVIQELKLPLYARIKLLGMLESTGLVNFNQSKRMLCIGNTMTALVRFERDDTVVLSIMKEYLAANPSYGLNLMYHQHLKGKVCGFIRAQRIYKGAGLQLYRRNAK